MSQLTRIAAGRSLSVRLSALADRASQRIKRTALPLTIPTGRSFPGLLRGGLAALLLTTAMAAPASAQVMTFTGATPSTYSGPGETITFHVSLGGSNAVTNSVELTRIAYGTIGPITCAGLPLEPLDSTTCSFSYVTQAGDVFGLNQSGTYRVTTLAAPRTRNIANTWMVPYVPVPPTASIIAATGNVAENGAQNLTYTVTLSDPAAAPVSVYFSLGGSASGADYSASGNPLVIATGSTTGTITIDPTGDTEVEPDETVTVSLVAGSGYTLGAPSSATGTIVNDDLPSLSINDVTLAEGNAGTTNATFTVSLAQPAGPGGVGFDIFTANGTATAGADYVATNLVAQTIPAGSSSYSFTVPVNGDTLNEPDETFFVNLTNVTNAVVADGQGVGTIVNDDAPPALSINSVSVTEGNAGTSNATFTVSLSAASSQTVTVNYGTSNGTATAGSDYTAAAGTLSFSPGATSRTLAVSVNGDTTVEADETFSVTLSAAVNASIATVTGTGTILNDDVIVVVNPATSTLPIGTYATPYLQALSASGGAAPYAFAITAGALPAGLALSSGGALSGTPTVSGTFIFTVTATDANGVTGSRAYVLPVLASPIMLTPASLAGGTVGAGYGGSVSASGGMAPYAYSISAGALPAGLTLASTGSLGGTPTAAGTFNLTVTATDANGVSGSRSYILSIGAPVITIAPATLPATTVAAAYNQSISAAGGTAPYSYALASGALPPGMTLGVGGVLSGSPQGGGTFTFTVAATDSSTGAGAPFTGMGAYSLVVNPATITLPATTLADGVRNTAYAAALNPASGGIAPYTYAVTGGTLPAGVTLAANGAFSGMPASTGTFTFSVTATDSSVGSGPYTATRADYSLTIIDGVPVANPVSATVAYGSVANPITLNLGGGVPTSIATPTLPAHGSVSVSGLGVTYTPTAGYSGADGFTYTASNGSGTSSPATISITVVDPTITVSASEPLSTTVGAAYSQTFTWAGGAAPYTGFAVAGLPAGLAISATSADSVSVAGTPTAGGSFTLIASATDSSTGNGPFAASRTFTLTVSAPALALTPAAGTLTASYDTAYSLNLSASGGTGPYAYSLVSGSLPAGLSLTSAGLLSGTPTAPGTYPLAIRATDSSSGAGAPFSITNNYSLVVAAPLIVIDPATLSDGAVGTPYSATLSASGGVAPYTYALSSGTLPNGVTFTSAGQFSGTPRSDGSFSLTVRATDANGQSGARPYTFNIAAPTLAVSPATLPGGTTNIAYSQALATSGGIAPYRYSLVSGSLPAGITFTSAGLFSGTPTTAGSYTMTVRSTDDAGYAVDVVYAIAIDAPDIVIDPATLGTAVVGDAYAATLTASGGAAPYAFSLESGTLPPGIGLDGAGALSGTPGATGTYTFAVRATDSNGNPGTRTYALLVTPRTLTLTPASLAAATAGAAYTAGFSTSGGIAPYTYVLGGGALPAGISLTDGVLGGIATTSGSFSFDITVTDSTASSVTGSYTLVVAAGTLVLDPAALPAGIAGTAYSQTLVASGGIAPYSYALSGGALPAGVNFTNGVLSGTPVASGSFSFDITATDSTGGTAATATRSYTLVIAPGTLSLDPASLADGVAGTAYRQALTAAGGIAPYRYALTSGALPAGLALADGVLSGTPTASGSFSFDISASDSTGGTAATVTRSFTLAIAAPAITITPATLPGGVRGSGYSQVLGASGGTAAYAFTLASGALPAGISLAGDGTLAGTPAADGSFNFTVVATDALGFTGSVTYAWTVARAAPTVADDAATTLGGSVLRIAVTGNDTGSIDSIAIATAPEHGTATVEGLEVVYTPEAGFTGTDSFQYTATGPGGTSAAATVTVTVHPLPVAVSRRLTANAGVAVQVELTEGASGGPFTAATLVSLAPATAGTANIAQAGSGDAARYVLTYTPAAAFSGLAAVRFTLDNAYATSAEATIEFDVTTRPDPSQDPEVRALLAAQAAATRRFATAQINNFQQRLESLHGQGQARFSNQVSFSADSDRDCESEVGRIPGRRCEYQARNDEVAHAAGAPAGAGAPQGASFGTWIGGVIRSGNHDGRGGSAGIDFESDGLSIGADYRLNGKFALGGGLGWGRDDSDVGEHGSRSEGKAYTAALYASFHPGDGLFVDGLMGYQDLSYDLRRHVTANGARVQGTRDGSQWFASLSAGADFRRGEHLQLTPYARLDLARATLDAYTEHGDPLYSLRYADMDVDTSIGNLGLRVDYRRERPWGLFSPQLRLEYQHDFQGNGEATMGYADQLSGPFYRTGVEAFDRNRFVLGLGAQFSTDAGLSTRIEYRGVVGDGGDSDHGLMLNIEKRY